MGKQIQTFLTQTDEAELSMRLRAVRPNIAFVDGGRWITSSPPIADTIQDCKDEYVFMWDTEVINQLPYLARPDGKYEGPRSGVVIELQRSKQLNRLLLAGRVAQSVGHSDTKVFESMTRFAADVWKVIKSLTTHPISIFDLETRKLLPVRVTEYRAGDDAVLWSKLSETHYLSSFTRNVMFKPTV